MMGRNWGDNEVRELLTLRAEAEIKCHFSGTVKDGPRLERLAKCLNELGYARDKAQVTTKLKALRRKYHELSDHNISGRERQEWPYFALCQSIWGADHSAYPVCLIRRVDVSAEDVGEAPPSCGSSTTAATEEVSGLDPEASGEEDETCENPAKRKLTEAQAVGKEIGDILHAMDREDEERYRLRLKEQRNYEEGLRREAREAERDAREDARRERAQHLEVIGSMIQSQTALLQNLIALISAPQHPGPQTPARHYPAPQRQISAPTPLYLNHATEEFDASSSFLQQLD